ncbi:MULTISPECIES: GNAT family N-acetyltransferase [unclassified Leisingera]|uniref:GNAT family N-acetyltransferase n=1 Tax=unclassified Leisingera TaxID=2614906 RepID=UPI000580621A|nr:MULTISPECIES: GNAT family N-acetyltransferase [unclassified Leisingera]KIC36705.1 acetyltransferase [Leisingera sp. ANG-M7]MDC0657534.1 GNAT family N-acetyltransferase [Leisingera sp. SS27]
MTLSLRPATPLDAGTVGEILYRFQQDTAWMPKLYSSAEVIFFCGVMIDRGWVTVAERDGAILGFLARKEEEVCSLYLAPGACGQGAGKMLLDAAKAASPRLSLRTFTANGRAQRFYQREGFTETGRGDGLNNEEGLPDIAYEWRTAPEAAA